jgi:hypothetical protein
MFLEMILVVSYRLPLVFNIKKAPPKLAGLCIKGMGLTADNAHWVAKTTNTCSVCCYKHKVVPHTRL